MLKTIRLNPKTSRCINKFVIVAIASKKDSWLIRYAVVLSDEGALAMSREGAAIDFVRDAFGHLKAIAVDKGGRALLKTANVGQDAGIVDVNDKDAFITAAKSRQWDREKIVWTLA